MAEVADLTAKSVESDLIHRQKINIFSGQPFVNFHNLSVENSGLDGGSNCGNSDSKGDLIVREITPQK